MTITVKAKNLNYEEEIKTSKTFYNQQTMEFQQPQLIVDVRVLEVVLSESEYEAIKKAVLETFR